MKIKAWQIERQMRMGAVPPKIPCQGGWKQHLQSPATDEQKILQFWYSEVPASGAPTSLCVGMVQSLANKGYQVDEAEGFLSLGLELARQANLPEVKVITAELMEKIQQASLDLTNPYYRFEHPLAWNDILDSMAQPLDETKNLKIANFEKKLLHGWQGQFAGAAFGSPLEGYAGEQICKVYGEVDHYLTSPETLNDDVVYELVFLEALERYGASLTSRQLALEWLRNIPYAYSAEEVALKNLLEGIFPPHSGLWRNPYSDWIGAQMRGMICGMIAAGKPLEAARFAHLDAVISHSANGVYGEMFSAVLTSLAFIESDIKSLITQAMAYLPQKSEYYAMVQEILAVLNEHLDPIEAWKVLDHRFETYHWIHAYPNIAAVLLALWYGNGEMTRSFSLLAMAGLDVDCNGGLVGTILGIQRGVPKEWAAPLQDTVETYLWGKEKLSITAIARRTARLALQLDSA